MLMWRSGCGKDACSACATESWRRHSVLWSGRTLRGLVLRDVPQCPVGHKLVDSGNLHQGHFGVMVHLSPGALFEGPGLYFLNFQPGNTQEPWRTTHRPGMVRAFGFEDTLTSVLRGWLGHNQSLGLPGHLGGSVRTPKWPAKGHRAVRAV